MILPLKGKSPLVDPAAFVAPNAAMIGDVVIGRDSSVWFGAVVRGDSNSIRIGQRTNIQDLCALHVNERHPLEIGDDVTVGHRAIVHGCRVGSRALIGMGAIMMNGAVIGEDSIVAAGALVTEGTVVPPRSLILGFPAKVKRPLTDEEVAGILRSAKQYMDTAALYR